VYVSKYSYQRNAIELEPRQACGQANKS